MQRSGKQMQALGTSLTTGLTLPLAGLGAVGIAKFAEFEDAMAKVKAISGATGDEFKALESDAKKLGETTRFTASQVAELQLNYSKLGFDPSQIVAATSATLDLALATGEDLANSATVAASTLRGFGLEADETQRVVDVMAASFSASALSLDKFQTAMAVLAPVARNAGLSIEDATGQLAVLVNAGVDASTAGTGLRNIYLDLAGSGRTLESALSQISNATNINAEAFNLFGKRGATVAAVLAQNYSEAQKFSTEFQNAGGSAAKMAAIMDNTIQGAFFRLKSAFEGAAISLGEQLAPTILKLAGFLTKIIGKFNELSPATKKFIVVLGGIAAAIGPLLALAGTILPAIATGLTILTGPIGLIIAGLTAIGVVIYKKWEPIKKTLIDIANYFIDLYNESTAFRVAVESVISVFKFLYEAGKFAFESLKSILKAWVAQFTNGFKTVGKIIAAVFKGEFSTIPDIIKEAGKTGAGNFKVLTTDLKSDWDGLMKGIKTVSEDTLEAITSKKKLKYLGENVDASEITDKVADATKKGLAKGLSGGSGSGPGKGVAIDNDLLDLENSVLDLEGLDQMLEDADIAGRLQEKVEAINFKNHFDKLTGDTKTFVEENVEYFENLEAKMQHLAEVGAAVGDAVGGAFYDMANNLVDGLGLADTGFEGFIKNLATTVTKLIAMMLSASMSQAIAGATASGTATGPAAIFTTPGFIATAISGILAAFAAIPKFATGGIVGGSSYYGDKLLARVNSGEAIFNQQQQKRLYDLTSGGGVVEVPYIVETKMRGADMLVTLERANKIKSRKS